MKSLIVTVTFGILLVITCRAETESTWKGSSEISFAGTSTLHNWTGKVNARPFAAKVSLNSKGEPIHLLSHVDVEASKMDTEERDRDVKMRESMRVTRYPLISAEMNCAFDKIDVNGATPTQLPFHITLLGKPHSVTAQISHWNLKDGMATFGLDFTLSLKACGIEVPSMLWVIKVGDEIHVHANVKLVRAGN